MEKVIIILCLLLVFCFLESAFAQWGPPKIIKSAPDTQIILDGSYYNRSVAADGYGRLHVIWAQYAFYDSSGGDSIMLYYQRSTDEGNTWGQSFKFSGESTGEEFCVATDGMNTVHVVWTAVWGIMYRRSSDGGNTWAPETVLVSVTPYGGGITSPIIVADERGNVHLSWSQWFADNHSEAAYKRSTDGGKTWDRDSFLTNTTRDVGPVTMALDPQGNPHIAWDEYAFISPTIIWYRNSSNKGLTWNPTMMIADSDTTLAGGSNIAVDGLGRVYVFFRAYWGSKLDSTFSPQIVYRVSKDGGQTFGPREPLTVYPLAPGFMSVTGDDKGGVHVAYVEGLYDTLYYNGSTDGGVTWRYHPAFNLTDSLMGATPSLTADPNARIHLVYRSGTRNPILTSWVIYRSGYPLGVEANPKGGFGGRDLARLEVYPNPVTSVAYLQVQVASGIKASLKIFDITGRLVRVLSSNLNTPKEVVVWDGKDGWGRPVPSGVYLCRLEGGGMETRQKALVLIR